MGFDIDIEMLFDCHHLTDASQISASCLPSMNRKRRFTAIAFPIYYILYTMSRSQPYRSRIPVHVIQLLDVASRITLFLVGQSGPLSFTFKDRLENKYKTQIGPELKCTCSPQRNDHCIHSVYILLKIFKVSVENPILWQAAYVDSQLEDLVSGKHTVNQVRRPRPAFENLQEEFNIELPSEFLRKKEFKSEVRAVVLSERMKLNEESVCPICQEDMREDMCLSYCKVKCGNNFHLECLKVWARHRTQEESSVNCPMCRSKFPETFLQELEQEERAHAKKQSEKIKLEFNCSSCGIKGIPNNPHKCLLCTTFELCEPCYMNNKHIKHPFVRQDADGRWRGAEERRTNELKIKNYIESKRKENFNDEILKKLRKIEEDPNKLFDYVASAYPYVSRYISDHIDPLKKMDFNPADIRCLKCGATKMIFLRRLSCGHFIDHECLKDCILKEKYYCAEDGSQFLKGFENLRQKQKENETKRNQEYLNLAPEFDVSHIERPQEAYNFVNNLSEEPTLTEILSSRDPPPEKRSEYMRDRFSNHIIREERMTPNREQSREPEPRLAPRQQIRIRNVGVSTKARSEATRPREPQDRTRNPVSRGISTNTRQSLEKKSKREQIQNMFDVLVGRKLK